MNAIPGRLERSMTALAFWVGYSHAKFGWHHLPEGAAVAEFWSLMDARLGPDEALLPEVAYSRLEGKAGKQVVLTGEHVDMAVVNRIALELDDHASIKQHVNVIIEVKRWGAAQKLVDGDVDRLATSLRLLPRTARAFVIVVSERDRPSRYLTAKNLAKKGAMSTRAGSTYRVRRVVKALSTAAPGSKSGHYVCLLEVMRPS